MNRLSTLTIVSALILFSVIVWVTVMVGNNQKNMPSSAVVPTVNPPSYIPSTVIRESLFEPGHAWTATLSAERVTTILATGDVLLARAVNGDMAGQSDFTSVWTNVADTLKNADITVINLETPFVENCPVTYTGMIFCGDVRNIDGLLFAGVDVVNLANNHMGNWGQDGVDTTVLTVTEAGLVPVGQVNPAVVTSRGKTIALLGYNDVGRQIGVAHVDDGTFEHDISEANKQADIVIVQFHWGNEYTHEPTERQVEIAHRAIDAGADLVIGNHPHWIQPPEIYKEKLIIYSHGNFIFDQTWSQKTQEGMMGRYVFYDDMLIDAQLIPVIIEGFGQVKIADEMRRVRILESIQ